ncbi:RTA1 like protein-domain-containing protein [Trametes maxima]|nr:RTA1 like protein-domain-containing protein [Trametes maxima]
MCVTPAGGASVQVAVGPLRHSASAPPSHSKVLAVLFALLFVSCGVVQVYSLWKWKGKWLLAMTIGCFTYGLGVACMASPSGLAWFFLLTTLSPCAFIAAEYVILGRLARHLQASQHLAISPRKVANVFIFSDVVTFAMQGAGTGIEIGQIRKVLTLGRWLLLGGLALQLVSFLFFTWMVVKFVKNLKRFEPERLRKDRSLTFLQNEAWLVWGLLLSCAFIIIRSVYRVIQFAAEGDDQSLGITGNLSSDLFFYLFDGIPLFIAVAVSSFFWPGRFITPQSMAPRAIDTESRSSAASAAIVTKDAVPLDKYRERGRPMPPPGPYQHAAHPHPGHQDRRQQYQQQQQQHYHSNPYAQQAVYGAGGYPQNGYYPQEGAYPGR